MTHFTVTVVGEDVKSILAPYDENIRVKPYPDVSPYDVYRKFKRFEIATFRKLQNGDPLEEFEKRGLEHKPAVGNIPSWWWQEYHGDSLDENGWGLSTYNPDSKWDWYSLGGRWSGTFPLKKGKNGKVGTPGVFSKTPEPGRVDQCRIGDVDWVSLHKEAREQAGEQWDTLFKPYDELEYCIYNEKYYLRQQEENVRIYGTKEEFIRRRGFWTTYALVSEKTGWIAPGEMGWWGIHTDETEDRDKFCKLFVETLKSFPKNTLISAVDCHI